MSSILKQESRPFLTIAIPTYNRSSLLRESIRALVPHIIFHNNHSDLKIELLIVDNCSNDKTQDVVETFQRSNAFIRLYKNNYNLGIDGNIYTCILLAKGLYVHLLSDDDKVCQDVYAELTNFLNFNRPYFVCLNIQLGDSNCKEICPNTPEIQVNGTGFVALEMNEFVKSVNIWMSFLSCFVINRDQWLIIKNHELFLGTEIYLSHIAFRLIAKAGVAYVSQVPSITARNNYSGSFSIIKAFAVEWLALCRQLPSLGYSPKVVSVLEKITVRKYMPGFVYKALNFPRFQHDLTYLLVKNLFRYPSAWVLVFPIAIMPSALISFLKRLRNFIKSLPPS